MKKCPLCKTGALRKGFTSRTIEVDGFSYTGRVPHATCTNASCGEGFYDGPDLERHELEAARSFLGQGGQTPRVLNYARRVLGLTAADLAALLGVTPETVSRWENGKMRPPRSAVAVLATLVADELAGTHGMRDQLEALAKAS